MSRSVANLTSYDGEIGFDPYLLPPNPKLPPPQKKPFVAGPPMHGVRIEKSFWLFTSQVRVEGDSFSGLVDQRIRQCVRGWCAHKLEHDIRSPWCGVWPNDRGT